MAGIINKLKGEETVRKRKFSGTAEWQVINNYCNYSM